MLENEDQIIQDYESLQSLREVARINYCSKEAVRLVLIRHQIERAPEGRRPYMRIGDECLSKA